MNQKAAYKSSEGHILSITEDDLMSCVMQYIYNTLKNSDIITFYLLIDDTNIPNLMQINKFYNNNLCSATPCHWLDIMTMTVQIRKPLS